jgi:hypothetical protein
MYRIVKRIVHTVTTVTWMVRWETGPSDEGPLEQQITFPATHSIVEETVADMDTKTADLSSKPILDEGEKS